MRIPQPAMERTSYGPVPAIELTPAPPARQCSVDESVYAPSTVSMSSRNPSDASVNTIMFRDKGKLRDRRKERLNTELLTAVIAGDTKQTLKLLKDGASPDATCRHGRVTAVHVAAYRGHLTILCNLLIKGARGDLRDKWGRQPSHLAAWAGHCGALELLRGHCENIVLDPIIVEHAPLPYDRDTADSWSHSHTEIKEMIQEVLPPGSTPLHLASKKAHFDCVNFLLTVGASVHARDSQGLTPLDIVGSSEEIKEDSFQKNLLPSAPPLPRPNYGRLNMMRSTHIYPRIPDNEPPKFNYTSDARTQSAGERIITDGPEEKPVHKIIKSLIEKGAKLPKSNIIIKEGSVQNQVKMNVTTLHTAVETNDIDLVHYLLEKSACMMTWNNNGETAVHLAVKKKLMEPLQKMLDWDAERPVVEVRDAMGRTPLHQAVIEEWACGVNILLEAGADIKTTTNRHETVLHLAAQRSNYTILKELLSFSDAQKVLEYRNSEYCTPLFQAVFSDSVECVQVLYEAGADLTATLPGDYTLLHVATEKNSRSVVEFLLGNGEHCCKFRDATCDNRRGGIAPIHIAASRGFTDVLRILLSSGCDVLQLTTPEPENTSTALHLAARNGHLDAVELILKHDITKKSLTAPDGNGWFPLHVAAQHAEGPCVRAMLMNGADISAEIIDDDVKRTALDIITYCVPQPVRFLEEIFDDYIETNKMPVNDPDCEIEVKYGILIPEGSARKQMTVLNALLNSGRQKLQEHLLLHPMVETFLCLKWQKLRVFFYVLMAFYMMLTVSLTSLSFLHYVFNNGPSNIILCLTIFSQAILVFCFVPIFLVELINLSQLQKYYLRDYETAVKWVVFLGTWIVGVVDPGLWWARYLASITVLLAWIELLFFIARCPSWGFYVLMFSKVANNVFKVLGTFIFLILGFTFSFMIHFQAAEPFLNFWEAFVKVMVMMIELDYTGTFPDGLEPNVFSVIGRGIFITFVILVAIVMTNLMVGLAVSDINLLETQGRTERLAKQIGFLSLLELFVYNKKILACLPRSLRNAIKNRRCVSTSIVIHPGSPRGTVFNKLPRCIRESVLDKVACRQVHEDNVDVQVSLQRLDQKVESLAGKLAASHASSSDTGSFNKFPKNEGTKQKTEQLLESIIQELQNLKSDVNALRSSNNNVSYTSSDTQPLQLYTV